MKTQLVLLSIAIMAINQGESVLPVPFTVSKSAKISETKAVDFAFFKVHRQGRGATAVWGLTSSAGVCAFTLQRTYQDPTDPYAAWEDVNSFVCGSARSFKYTDENVFPGYIAYRVTAWLFD